jgi:hypothetical protein
MYFVMILISFCILGTLFRKKNMVADGAQSVTVLSSFLFSDVGLTALFSTSDVRFDFLGPNEKKLVSTITSFVLLLRLRGGGELAAH